jgi:hypothetical protein
VLSSTHNKKAERLYDYHNPNKRKASLSQREVWRECEYDWRLSRLFKPEYEGAAVVWHQGMTRQYGE